MLKKHLLKIIPSPKHAIQNHLEVRQQIQVTPNDEKINPPTSAYVGGLILILCFNHTSSSLVIRTNSFMLYIIKFHMPGLDNIEEPITTFA